MQIRTSENWNRLLCACVVIVAACQAPALVTIAQITTSVNAVVSTLSLVKSLCASDSTELKGAYDGLSATLKAPPVDDAQIEHMERTLDTMQKRQENIRLTLKQSIDSIDEMFKVLDRKSNQIKDDALRESSLEAIDRKKKELKDRLARADVAIKTLNDSVQKYADIVGAISVDKGLQQLDSKMHEIDEATSAARKLTADAERAINESLDIVRLFSPDAVQTISKPALIASTVEIPTQGRCTNPWVARFADCSADHCTGSIQPGQQFRLHLANIRLGSGPGSACTGIESPQNLRLCVTDADGEHCLMQHDACTQNPVRTPTSLNVTSDQLLTGLTVVVKTDAAPSDWQTIEVAYQKGLTRDALCIGGYADRKKRCAGSRTF